LRGAAANIGLVFSGASFFTGGVSSGDSSSGRAPVLAAVLAVFGFFDVPFVYLSIRIFRTQHPQPVMGGGENSGLDPVMAHAFLWNLVAFTCYALLVIWMRYRQQIAEQAVEEAHAERALGERA
jgi:heme exporter protein C